MEIDSDAFLAPLAILLHVISIRQATIEERVLRHS
jgi:hypothetical protein